MASKLLIDEEPLQVLPSLAKAIGLNDAIFLQQIHYWLRRSKHEHDGCKWIYNTYEQWQEQFPFWSLDTMQRIAKRLLEADLIRVERLSKGWSNQNWYTINYEAVENMGARLSAAPDHSRKLRLS